MATAFDTKGEVLELVVSRKPLRLVMDNERTGPDYLLDEVSSDHRWAYESWRGYEAYQLAVECGAAPDLGSWWTLSSEQRQPFADMGEMMLQRELLAFQRGERSEGLEDMRQEMQSWERSVEQYQKELNEALEERDKAHAKLAHIELATGLRSGVASLDELEQVCEHGSEG
jgi:hypothetical protein